MSAEFPLMLYQTAQGQEVSVKIEGETLWLNQEQMGQIFAIDRTVVTKHIRNIIKEGELSESSTRAIFAHVQKEGGRDVSRDIAFYNLDMIISVGYRVNSAKATQFRKRATQILKEHIVKGYTLNTPRIAEVGLSDLQATLVLVKKSLEAGNLSLVESKGLIDLMVSYIPSLITLGQYDKDMLPTQGQTNEQKYIIELDEAYAILDQLKNEMMEQGQATDLFALPRDHGLESIIGAIYQGYSGEDIYSTVEEKAANLLYLTIKNHPFVDGNKRSGAFLFVWYLSKNNILHKPNGSLKVSEETLVAIALLVATSDTAEKDLIIRVILAILV